jgi:hypothetical protein
MAKTEWSTVSDSPRFGFEDVDYRAAEKPKRNSCLVGCLWTAAILIVLMAVAIYLFYTRGRQWIAAAGAQTFKAQINAANLPEEEKQELGVEVDRLADAVGEGRLSTAQIETIVKAVFRSPLAGGIVVAVADAKYFSVSGLTEEERAAGRITLRRFTAGAVDGSIPEQQREAVLAQVAVRGEGDTWRMRDALTDEELRKFLTDAQAAADAAEVEAEPPQVDLSDELKRIVDEALAAAEPAP